MRCLPHNLLTSQQDCQQPNPPHNHGRNRHKSQPRPHLKGLQWSHQSDQVYRPAISPPCSHQIAHPCSRRVIQRRNYLNSLVQSPQCSRQCNRPVNQQFSLLYGQRLCLARNPLISLQHDPAINQKNRLLISPVLHLASLHYAMNRVCDLQVSLLCNVPESHRFIQRNDPLPSQASAPPFHHRLCFHSSLALYRPASPPMLHLKDPPVNGQ